MNTRRASDPPAGPVPDHENGKPRIEAAEFRARRERLMAALTGNDIAVVPGASIRYRNRDTEYPFRQDSDFYYLTGFEEPDSVLVLAPGAESGAAILFCPERDPAREQWTGERLGPERAPEALGVDVAFPNSELDDILPPHSQWPLVCPHRIGRTPGIRPASDRMCVERPRAGSERRRVRIPTLAAPAA